MAFWAFMTRSLRVGVPSLAFACGIVATMERAVVAQNQAPQNDLTVIEMKGKFEEWKSNLLQVTDGSGKKKSIQMPNEVQQVSYRGTAKLDWIQIGMYVRLTAELDAQMQPRMPASEVELFRPMQNMRRVNEEEMKRNIPGVYPAGVGKGTNLLEQKKTPAATEAQKFDIVGMIQAKDAENLLILAGNQRIKIQVNAKTKVNVFLNGLDLVKNGDAIQVNGLYSPQSPDLIMAQSIAVTGAKPLAPEENLGETGSTKTNKNAKNSKTPTKGSKKDKDNKDEKDSKEKKPTTPK